MWRKGRTNRKITWAGKVTLIQQVSSCAAATAAARKYCRDGGSVARLRCSAPHVRPLRSISKCCTPVSPRRKRVDTGAPRALDEIQPVKGHAAPVLNSLGAPYPNDFLHQIRLLRDHDLSALHAALVRQVRPCLVVHRKKSVLRVGGTGRLCAVLSTPCGKARLHQWQGSCANAPPAAAAAARRYRVMGGKGESATPAAPPPTHIMLLFYKGHPSCFTHLQIWVAQKLDQLRGFNGLPGVRLPRAVQRGNGSIAATREQQCEGLAAAVHSSSEARHWVPPMTHPAHTHARSLCPACLALSKRQQPLPDAVCKVGALCVRRF